MATILSAIIVVIVAVAFADGWAYGKADQKTRRNLKPIDEDAVVFPDSHHTALRRQPTLQHDKSGDKSSNETYSRGQGQVPLELARRFNNFENFESFVDAYVDNKVDFYSDNGASSVSINSRFGGGETKAARESVPTAKPAACIPDMTVVPLEPPGPQDPSVFHMPTCTRVPRCGGCCGNHLLSCQPTQTKMRTLKIYEMSQRKNTPHYKRFINISVEEHVKCQCDCVLKEEDCGSNQVYSKSECRCICPGNGGLKERECAEAGRYWDASSCQCLCPNQSECSTGSFFDHGLCSCARK